MQNNFKFGLYAEIIVFGVKQHNQVTIICFFWVFSRDYQKTYICVWARIAFCRMALVQIEDRLDEESQHL